MLIVLISSMKWTGLGYIFSRNQKCKFLTFLVKKQQITGVKNYIFGFLRKYVPERSISYYSSLSQLTLTCSKSTKETLGKGVKYVQS